MSYSVAILCTSILHLLSRNGSNPSYFLYENQISFDMFFDAM